MIEIFFLLLPIAFYSGWRAAQKHFFQQQNEQCQLSDRFVKGVNFLLSEQPDKALEVFLNYPDIDEYTAETYHLLGNLFRNRGEVDRALRVHQNLIARTNLQPEQKEKAMFSLGTDFFAAGMLDRAESVFQELMQTTQLNNNKKGMASVCSSLRTIYEQTREWQKAIDATHCIQKYLSPQKGEPSLNNDALIVHYYCELADEALHQGNLHLVDNFILLAKKSHKKSTRIMTLEGDIAFHQKNYTLATTQYLRAIEQDSRLLGMLFNKLIESAKASDNIILLQKELYKYYKKQPDKSLFEAIIELAKQFGSSDKIDQLILEELPVNKLNLESIYKSSGLILQQDTSIDSQQGLTVVNQSLAKYLQGLPRYTCEHCGYKLHDYLWRCPACHHWDTIDHA